MIYCTNISLWIFLIDSKKMPNFLWLFIFSDQTGEQINVSALTDNNNKGNHLLNLSTSDCHSSVNLINNDIPIDANKTNDAKLQMGASKILMSENILNASLSRNVIYNAS